MSKLLKESQVRKMMKLANLAGLSEGFVSEMYSNDMDEGMDGDMYSEEMDDMRDAEGDMDVVGDDDAMPDDDAMSDDDDDGMESAIEDVIGTLVSALKDEYGDAVVDMEVEEEEEDEEEPMADAPDDEGDEDEDDMGDMGDDEPMLGEVELVDEQELVSEVYRRVTERLRNMIRENKSNS